MGSTEMRQEKDSLGMVEVPAGAMYGAQTARAVENYPISGMRAAGALIRAIGMVKKVAAEANGELGVVSKERAEAIAAAAQEVIDGEWDKEFVVDVFQAGAGVSFHMNANEVIANRANQLVAVGKVRGASFEGEDPESIGFRAEGGEERAPGAKARIDSAPVMPGLKSRPISEASFSAAFEAVPLTKNEAASREAEAVPLAKGGEARRTHMQDATPIRLGQEFAAYGVAVRKAAENIRRAAEGLRELGLGGSAVGTGINTHPEYRVKAIERLAVISGQRLVPAEDMRWAMQSCGTMAEVSAALRGLALEVIRIANDLRLMASGPNTGFNEIALPSLQPGSSIMPGKINPVLAELAAMVGFQVIGNDTAVAMAVQAGQLELNVM